MAEGIKPEFAGLFAELCSPALVSFPVLKLYFQVSKSTTLGAEGASAPDVLVGNISVIHHVEIKQQYHAPRFIPLTLAMARPHPSCEVIATAGCLHVSTNDTLSWWTALLPGLLLSTS